MGEQFLGSALIGFLRQGCAADRQFQRLAARSAGLGQIAVAILKQSPYRA